MCSWASMTAMRASGSASRTQGFSSCHASAGAPAAPVRRVHAELRFQVRSQDVPPCVITETAVDQ